MVTTKSLLTNILEEFMTALLSTTQEDILELASSREDGMVLPFPDDLKLKGGAVHKVLNSMVSKGFIKKVEGDDFIITNKGRKAIDADLVEEEPEIEKPATEGTEEAETEAEPVIPTKTGKVTPTGKLGQMLAFLKREEGATVTDLMEVTGWQKHSVRGAMSGQLKKKYGLISKQIATKDKEIVYQIAD